MLRLVLLLYQCGASTAIVAHANGVRGCVLRRGRGGAPCRDLVFHGGKARSETGNFGLEHSCRIRRRLA